MNGVVVSVKGRYAVLLNKNSEFVKVKNKNYSVGDKVKIPQYKGQILAAAASFIVVCGGISSYFMPAKYMSVDINPSVMMTINIYNRVINTKPLNNDAQVLLAEANVNGMSVSESMDELIKKSEEIGYLNEHNNGVIVEVVDGIGKIKLPDKNYGNVEVIIENADKTDLKNAKEMGVSIAKAKAIVEYTKQNGGSVEENADKLENQSVKDIRRNLENKAEVKVENKSEIKAESKPIQQVENKDNSSVVQKSRSMVRQNTENVSTKVVQEISKNSGTKQSDNSVEIINNDNKSDKEDKKIDTVFDDLIIKTLPNPIQDKVEDIELPVEKTDDFVKNNSISKSEESVSESNNEPNNKDEIIVPSEPKNDETVEEVKPQPSHGDHITQNNRPNNSNQDQEELPKDDKTDKPDEDIGINPPKTDKDEEKTPQDNPNHQPQEPDKPFEDKDNNHLKPQEPNLDGGNETPNEPNNNSKPPFENDRPPQDTNIGNNPPPEFHEPTRPNESNDFGGNKNDPPPEHNDLSPSPSEPHENGNSPVPNDGGMSNFDDE